MDQEPFKNHKKKFQQGPKIIKKYGNRKLYDTEQSSYVVLKDIEKMIRDKEDIQIIDNETQDDITVSTLTQIIFSSEKKSNFSPPVHVLKSIIRGGDGSFSSFLAKLGIFKKPSKNSPNSQSKQDMSSQREDLIEPHQSLEQKLTKLMSSNDALNESNNEDLIPQLPGHGLN